jgi:hypothetical protein
MRLVPDFVNKAKTALSALSLSEQNRKSDSERKSKKALQARVVPGSVNPAAYQRPLSSQK